MVTDAPAAAIVKPARHRFSNASVIGVGVGAALTLTMVIGGLLLIRDRDSDDNRPPPFVSNVGPAASVEPSGDRDDSSQGEAVPAEPVVAQPNDGQIDDDGQTLWTSPTAGAPLALSYLPSGAQAFLVVRPAELVASDEGLKLLDALGQLGESMKTKARATLGVGLEDIEQLSIASFPDESGTSQMAFAMRLAKAIPQATLWEAWGKPPQVEQESKKFFASARWAYYLPDEEQGRLVAIAPVATMQGDPRCRRSAIDRQRHRATATRLGRRATRQPACDPQLFAHRRRLLEGDLEKLRDPLAQFLDESIEAVLVSAHLGDELFRRAARACAGRSAASRAWPRCCEPAWIPCPSSLQAYVASLEPQALWPAVVDRFPRMVQVLNDYTRAGVEDRQAVLRDVPAAGSRPQPGAGHGIDAVRTARRREAGEATSPPAQLRAAPRPPWKRGFR